MISQTLFVGEQWWNSVTAFFAWNTYFCSWWVHCSLILMIILIHGWGICVLDSASKPSISESDMFKSGSSGDLPFCTSNKSQGSVTCKFKECNYSIGSKMLSITINLEYIFSTLGFLKRHINPKIKQDSVCRKMQVFVCEELYLYSMPTWLKTEIE